MLTWTWGSWCVHWRRSKPDTRCYIRRLCRHATRRMIRWCCARRDKPGKAWGRPWPASPNTRRLSDRPCWPLERRRARSWPASACAVDPGPLGDVGPATSRRDFGLERPQSPGSQTAERSPWALTLWLWGGTKTNVNFSVKAKYKTSSLKNVGFYQWVPP